MKKTKTETVRKADDGSWQFMHPTTREWVGAGELKSRNEARDARKALLTPKQRKAEIADAVSQLPDADAATRAATDALISSDTGKVVDNAQTRPVDSSSLETTPAHDAQTSTNNSSKGAQTMDITLTKSDKPRKSSSIVYLGAGLRGGIRVAKSCFKDGNAPASLVLSSDAFAEPKVKMSAEERKAARAAAPKKTAAEKLAALETRAAKLREKVAKESAAPATA